MPTFQLTVRFGAPALRYHTAHLQASDLVGALEAAARALPEEVSASADLIEIRTAVDPEGDRFPGEPRADDAGEPES